MLFFDLKVYSFKLFLGISYASNAEFRFVCLCKSYLDEDEPHENRNYGKEQSTDEHEYSRDYICAEKQHCGNPTTAKREKK